MKTKKSKKANLENFRTIFFQIGLILVLSAILFAFEWKSSIKIEKLSNKGTTWIDIEDLPPITMPKEEVPEVKPPSFELKIVDDFQNDVIDDLTHLISEIDELEEIKIVEFVKKEEEVDEIVLVAQFMPAFQGKDGSCFRNYVAENVSFPNDAKENEISGTVYVSFIIDKDGLVTNVEILRGVHPIIDKAVLEVIKNSPRWEPGINNGKYVRVKYAIAIAFKLE